MKRDVLIFLLPSAIWICDLGFAQSYSVDWFTIERGGGTSNGGVYSVSGTIGQSDANAQLMIGGSFSLTGGFWSLFAVQTAGAPLLSIQRQGQTVRVSWPLSRTGFVLDQSLTVTGARSQVSAAYSPRRWFTFQSTLLANMKS